MRICSLRLLLLVRRRRRFYRGHFLAFQNFLLEAIDAAFGVHQLLAAGEERVAVGADFQVDIALVSGSRGKRVPARAHDAYFVVNGMNVLFHYFPSFGSPGHTEPLREFTGNF